MHEDAYQQRAETMPKDDATLPPDATVDSVNVSVAELVRRECVWLQEHAQ